MKRNALLAAVMLFAVTAFTSGCKNAESDNTTASLIALLLNTGDTVTHLAGSDGGPGYRDGTGMDARFRSPYGVAGDTTNVYVSDTYNHVIRKIVISTGVVTTIAGAAGETGASDGAGTTARFNSPRGMFSDGTYLYVADRNNNSIRRIVIASGVATTLAGSATGESGSSDSSDGTGATARFDSPEGIASDGTNLYVTDMYNNTIRKIVIATGETTTLAGSAAEAHAYQDSTDGTGATARFYYPAGITRNGDNLYVVDYFNYRIRLINRNTGDTTTFAGSGTAASTNGTGTGASFGYPWGITNDGTNLYVVDYYTHAIRQIVIASAVVTTIAGTAGLGGYIDGTGLAARFNYPFHITMAGSNLYVADSTNHAIRKIVISTQEVTTLAGSPGLSGTADGFRTAARFNHPYGIFSDGRNAYVADYYNHSIRKVVIATGKVTTIAGSTTGEDGDAVGFGTAARFDFPAGITGDSESLYVTDRSNHKIRKILIATGEVSTLAGSTSGYSDSTDGTGATAEFMYPEGIASDTTALYVADSGSNSIRKIIIATGETTTLAGSATGVSGSDDSSDGTGATALFYNPAGISIDGANLYVADTHNFTIRKVVIATGETTTFAGLAGENDATDGAGTAARFNYPKGMTSDGTNLYVADSYNSMIRKIVIATAEVTTLAGMSGYGSNDGDVSTASFLRPEGIAFDLARNALLVSDSGNNCIRKILLDQ